VLPAWSALIVHVPAATKVTVEPLTPLAVQTAVVALVKVTGLPDAPPVAVTVYVAPPNVGLLGVEVNVIV
jgi:hypothetical protein